MSLYAFFDSFIDVILVIDGEGRLQYGNSSASILLSLSTKRLAGGRPLQSVIHFKDETFLSPSEIVKIDEPSQMREVSFTLPTGASGSAQVLIQPQPTHLNQIDQTSPRWLIYFRDVSLEKTLQAKYRAELEQKESVIRDLQVARDELQLYSKDLEKMVAARTQDLSGANHLLKTILDSLGQGILVFGRDGRCLPIHSQICHRILEIDPVNQLIEDVLHLKGSERSGFEKWRDAVFDELLDFRDMVPLAPGTYKHGAGLQIALEYHSMQDAAGHIQGVVLVATDRTMESKALKKAEKERELVAKVTQVARNRDVFRLFVVDAKWLLEELRRPERLDLVDVARRLHTLKGAAGSFALSSVAKACHDLEDHLKALAGGDRSAFDRLLKSQAEKILADLDRELQMLGELLGPMGVAGEVQMVEIPLSTFRDWSKELIGLAGQTKAQEIGIQMLKESSEKNIGASVQHMGPPLVELAKSLGKQVSAFEITGGDIKIPSYFGQALFASLVHAFRNSVFHGLETPVERKALKKPEGGKIAIDFQKDDVAGKPWLVIHIKDDGRGVSVDAVRRKLREKNPAAEAQMSDNDVVQAILRDDLSTANTVTEIAGRGVGMSAIANEARKLGGSVIVHSKIGVGMELEVRVPFPRGTDASQRIAS